ncbi:MAG: NAD(P) transhydrogenase subunit alpha [SAR202 cluster bacterium]|nr:NAD(P) transhydrogenase subunit alpha [SAR202 cluster bacterium]
MKIGVINQVKDSEKRVLLTPADAAKLIKLGHSVYIESNSGSGAFFPDTLYTDVGASISNNSDILSTPDIILSLNSNDPDIINKIQKGKTLITNIPLNLNNEFANNAAKGQVTLINLGTIPRIARAQSMDILSSQSSLAGYKATLIAAQLLGKIFPMMMTAAGTIPPAHGLILGAGVAGLQSIATSRRLGAVVSAYDVRPVVKEQVESLGAKFLQLDFGEQNLEDSSGYAKEVTNDIKVKEDALVHQNVALADYVITTALIPGRPAPLLVNKDMVSSMKPGSVIIDMAAEMGGNCELTKPGETIISNDVIISGPINLPSQIPNHASQMLSANIISLLKHFIPKTELIIDLEDEITQQTCTSHEGINLLENNLNDTKNVKDSNNE